MGEEGINMEVYNVILHDTICSGFRTLADKLDECIADLPHEKQRELMTVLHQAWGVIERRSTERRNHVQR